MLKTPKMSHTVDKHLKCHKIQESDIRKSHKYEMSHFDKSFANKFTYLKRLNFAYSNSMWFKFTDPKKESRGNI